MKLYIKVLITDFTIIEEVSEEIEAGEDQTILIVALIQVEEN